MLALLAPLVAGCGWLSSFGGQATAEPSVHRPVYPSAPKSDVPRWIRQEHLPQKATRSAALLQASGCVACHTYDGSGSSNLNAPDLTAIGRRHLGIRFQIAHLKCPSCVNLGSPMPPFRRLGMKRLRELAIFLEASKGRR